MHWSYAFTNSQISSLLLEMSLHGMQYGVHTMQYIVCIMQYAGALTNSEILGHSRLEPGFIEFRGGFKIGTLGPSVQCSERIFAIQSNPSYSPHPSLPPPPPPSPNLKQSPNH